MCPVVVPSKHEADIRLAALIEQSCSFRLKLAVQTSALASMCRCDVDELGSSQVEQYWLKSFTFYNLYRSAD